MKLDAKIIFERQNMPGMVGAQKSANYCYSYGKKLVAFLAVVSILVPIISNVLLLIFTNQILANVLSVIALCCFLIAEILRSQVKKYKFYGAGLQQYFDEFVFGLKNSCKKYLQESKLSSDQRLALLKKYEHEDNEPFLNWYSDYSKLPYEKAVYHCQKENLRWDKKLREKYLWVLVASLSIIIIAIVIHAVLNNQSTNELVAIILSGIPVISYLFNGVKKLVKDIKNQNDIMDCIERLEVKMNSSKEIWDEIEELQVEIFRYRKTNYLIPNWFYKLYKNTMQQEEDYIAQKISGENNESNDKDKN